MAIGQAGSITTSSPTENELIRVDLDTALTDPVFALTATSNGGHPFVLRVVDTQTNGDGDVISFDFIIEEWEYLDGPHPATETINWLAIESGVHTLPDGRVIEAGTISSNPGSGNTAVSLNGGFVDPPVVLTSVMSNNDTTTVDSDPLNITTTGFNIQMQEEEAEADNHASETVGYIAIQGGGDGSSGTASTINTFDDDIATYSLGATFSQAIVLGETQTINGGNTANVSIDTQTNSTVDMFLQEEASQDAELNHINETLGLVAFENGVILCFGPDARIRTSTGRRRVTKLQPGDRILTQDNGLQTLRWIARSYLSPQELCRAPHLAPIHIARGSLGRNLPKRDLTVSPQHRLLLSGWQAELMFGMDEVLVPAKALINGDTITQMIPAKGADYFHLLFDRHEVIEANGIWSESLHPAQLDTAYLLPDAVHELNQIFPKTKAQLSRFGPLARPALSVREAAVLAA